MGMPAMIWGQGVMCGEDVHANQNNLWDAKCISTSIHMAPHRMFDSNSPSRQQNASQNHRRQSLFRCNLATALLELALVSRQGASDNEPGAAEDADKDGDEGESADTEVVAALFLEGDGVGLEEEVENAVDEAL